MTLRNTLVQRFNAIDPSSAIRSQVTGTNPPGPSVSPFGNYAQPNPSPRAWTREHLDPGQGYTATFLTDLNNKANEISHTEQVFDNPVRKLWDGNLYSFLQNIAPTNPIPSNVTNWPNPLGYQYPQDLRNWANKGFNELEAGVVQVPAEANYDWPNPKGYIYPDNLRTFTQNTAQTLKGITQVPVQAYDWPNPTLRPWTPAPVVFTNALQTLAIQPPLKRENWPNPVLANTPTDRLGFENNYSDILLGLISPPIRQSDWVNPSGYTYPQDLRFWSQGIIAAEDTPPNNQYTWPNPTLKTTALNQLSYTLNTSPVLKALVQTPPPTQYDRPNPRGYLTEITTRTGQAYPTPLTLTSFVPPVTTGQHNRYFFADMGSMWSNR